MKRMIILFLAVTLSFSVVPLSAQTTVFQDVPTNHWAYVAIEEAYRNGIVYGTFTDLKSGKKYFSPETELTGAEFLTILGRAFYVNEMKEYEKHTNDWHGPAKRLAEKYNLLNEAGGIRRIHHPLNRYEMAAILCNVLERRGVRLPDEKELAKAGSTSGFADSVQITSLRDRKNVATVFHFGLLSGIDSTGTFAGEMSITRAQAVVIYQKLKDFFNRPLTSIENEEIPAGPTQSGSDKKREEFQAEVLRLINEERTKLKLAPLVAGDDLERQAQIRAVEASRLFSHTRPNGEDSFSVLKEAGIAYRYAGENIAAGHTSPQAVVAAWMRSEGHRANILSERFSQIGIGYVMAADSEYKHYWVQIFIEPKTENIKKQ